MRDVSGDHDPQSLEPPEAAPDRERVQEGLRRMLVRSVAGVDDPGPQVPRQEVGDSGTGMADHDQVRRHGLEVARGVDQRLALLDGAALGGEGERVGREPLLRGLEGEPRSGGGLEEQIDHHPSAQRRDLLDRALADRPHGFRRVEDQTDLFGREVLGPEEILRAQRACGGCALGRGFRFHASGFRFQEG